jgi:RimJ/RimL family protein N-acetyltransferase
MKTPSGETGAQIRVRSRSWTLWHPWGVTTVEARLGRRRVGVAHVSQAYRRELGVRSWWIVGLSVDAGHRRQGIGRRIVAACLAAAAERDLSVLYAAVLAGNAPSLALFESMGFTRVADRSLEEAVARVHKRLFRPPPKLLVLTRRTDATPPKG